MAKLHIIYFFGAWRLKKLNLAMNHIIVEKYYSIKLYLLIFVEKLG